MGSGASASTSSQAGVTTISLKKLPEAIEESVYVHEKFPLIIDPSEQASRFLKYQMGSYINMDDPTVNKSGLNRSLVGSFLHGRTMTLKFNNFDEAEKAKELFEVNLFPQEILSRTDFFQETVWKSILKPALGDPNPEEASISQEFVFIICCTCETVPSYLLDRMHVIRVVDKTPSDATPNGEGSGGDQGDIMDQVAALYGAAEVVRNSPQLVEAAFDGDLSELQSWVDKGFHIESSDGRKHTALSEAACQGHAHVVRFLLEAGADPNATSDTGRTPLWRAAFNSHTQVALSLLLFFSPSPTC